MSQVYSSKSREMSETALPDIETFEVSEGDDGNTGDLQLSPGWYWWGCFPGCLPDGDPIGPFDSEEEAIADAQEWYDE